MSDKNAELVRKFKPLTQEELKTTIKAQEEAKKQYSIDTMELEKELENFNSVSDPIINPATNKALCWVRRPSQAEWEAMVPQDVIPYTGHPESMPPEIAKKNNDLLFSMMEKIIVNPKHDAEYWKTHANLQFIQLFNMHLTNTFKDLGIATTNF
jgi:hypothetical protein